MQYLNPLATLSISLKKVINGLDKDDLKKEKKKLLAEFELNNTPVIELRGHKLDKTAVLTLFDTLEDETALAHHAFVFKSPLLMRFLEKGTLDYFKEKENKELDTADDSFKEFVAPYFAFQYNRLLLKVFKSKDWEEIDLLVSHPLPFSSKVQVDCYKDTLHYIHGQVIEVEGVAANIAGGKSPDGVVQELCDEFLINSLNELPEYFAGVRDRYGLSLEALALAVHNSHQRVQLGIIILRQGLKLKISENTEGRLKYVLDQLLAMAPAESIFDSFTGGDSSDKKPNAWWIAIGVGAAIFLLASIFK